MSTPTNDTNVTAEDMEEPLLIAQDVLHGLEDLHHLVIDVEAAAHAAAQALEFIPYIPLTPRGEPGHQSAGFVQVRMSETGNPGPGGMDHEAPYLRMQERDLRREYGRLQSLVHRTAELAFDVLEESRALIDKANAAVRHSRRTGERPLVYTFSTNPPARA